MDRNHIRANTQYRPRLRDLINRLSPAELALLVVDSWTIAALLAHLAFWDYRLLGLLRRWEQTGISSSPIDIDNINNAMQPLLLAIPGQEATRLALDAAKAVDAAIEHLPAELKPGVDQLVQEGKLRLDRSLHRDEHLDQIERILAKSSHPTSSSP